MRPQPRPRRVARYIQRSLSAVRPLVTDLHESLYAKVLGQLEIRQLLHQAQ